MPSGARGHALLLEHNHAIIAFAPTHLGLAEKREMHFECFVNKGQSMKERFEGFVVRDVQRQHFNTKWYAALVPIMPPPITTTRARLGNSALVPMLVGTGGTPVAPALPELVLKKRFFKSEATTGVEIGRAAVARDTADAIKLA